MYSHIRGRGSGFPEMKRIVEPPMHIDSALSSNIQFADWVAARVTRAIDYQLIKDSRYRWVAADRALSAVHGSFTHESKVHLWHRALSDLSHSSIVRPRRPLHPTIEGQTVGDVDPTVFRRMKAAAEKHHYLCCTSNADGVRIALHRAAGQQRRLTYLRLCMDTPMSVRTARRRTLSCMGVGYQLVLQ